MVRIAIFNMFVAFLSWVPLNTPSNSAEGIAVRVDDDNLEIVIYRSYIKIGSIFYKIQIDNTVRNYVYPDDLRGCEIECYDILVRMGKNIGHSDYIVYSPDEDIDDIYVKSITNFDTRVANNVMLCSSCSFKLDKDGTLLAYLPAHGSKPTVIKNIVINDGSVGVKGITGDGNIFLMRDDSFAIISSLQLVGNSLNCNIVNSGLRNIIGVYKLAFGMIVHTNGGDLYHLGDSLGSKSLVARGMISTTFDIIPDTSTVKKRIKGAHTMEE